MRIIAAAQSDVVIVSPERGTSTSARGLDDRTTCLAADPRVAGRVWCGTRRNGVYRSDDGATSWVFSGLADRHVTGIAASPTEADVVWAGTEPSEMWRSDDGGATWERSPGMESLPSSSEWSFPPRPDTHHVRWIACHPADAGRLWVAIEAGALVSTPDGGRTWRDRVHGGPYDTHSLAIHRMAPDTLRVAAGDGYYESSDGGVTWTSPRAGLDVGYLVSVAIDPERPDVVVVSAATGPFTAYGAGASDGRLYRRVGDGEWKRVVEGWPDPPDTIAPLLTPGASDGELWAADDRGVHRSDDGGVAWQQVAGWPKAVKYVHGLTLVR